MGQGPVFAPDRRDRRTNGGRLEAQEIVHDHPVPRPEGRDQDGRDGLPEPVIGPSGTWVAVDRSARRAAVNVRYV